MPDHNTPPGQLTENPFGQIVRIKNRVTDHYQITPLDYLYLCYAAHWEETHYPWLVVWAIIQRFGGAAQVWRVGQTPRVGAFKSIIEQFCAPVSPNFQSEGPRSPELAGRGCDCAAHYFIMHPRSTLPRNRSPWSGTGRGIVPGPRSTGNPLIQIPGGASPRVWNQIHCSRGTEPGGHGGDNKGAERQRRWATMRIAMGVESGDMVQAWLRGGTTYSASEEARRSAWGICTGQMGNPIPGFDNWAHYDPNRQTHAIILPEMSEDERQRQISNANTTAAYVFGAGRDNPRPNQHRYSGYTNRYHYRSFLTGDATVHIECNVGGVNRNSDNAPIDYSHYGNGSTGVTISGSNTATGTPSIAPAGGTVPTTNQGLAPTEQRPASSGSSSTQIQSELPDRATLFGQLNAWADTVEVTLSQNLGRGLRR